jgi:site-specific DNA recombinase
MRVAIYARFSSEMQDKRSIDDQVVLCRDFARQHGWTFIDAYPDYAVSGSSVHGRFAFERLVNDAKAGRFDIILAEDLDRLSRNQADIALFYERMTFVGVKLWTVLDGEIAEIHIGLKGTMSALFLKALSQKIHRGMAGRVRNGKNPGGLCYGYRVTSLGEREIVEERAAVVRRIFRETIQGRAPREIAAGLNRDNIPSPRGGNWNASTINGSRKRGNGILRQDLYVGRLVWNRQRFVKNPDTGRRITRLNSTTQHQISDVPHLRILDESDWQNVQKILKNKGGEITPAKRRSPHIFSGLLKCGACGSSYISAGGSKYPRFKCSRRQESNTCDNHRMISARIIEDRTLTVLESHLLDEEVVSAAVKEYIAERRRLEASREQDERRRSKRLGEIERAIKALIGLVENGAEPATLAPRLKELEAEKASAVAEQAHRIPDVIELHPGIADRYRKIVRDLRASLADRPHEHKFEVIASIRDLVDKIVIYPHNDPSGRDLELVGQLAALFGPAHSAVGGMRKMVAEEGFEPPTYGL